MGVANILESGIMYHDEDRAVVLGAYTRLDGRVRAVVDDIILDELNAAMGTTYKAESPIEQMMALVLNYGFYGLRYDAYRRRIKKWQVYPQEQIKTNRGNYRADFLLTVTLPDDHQLHLVIECDGHEFHEKTKKQAAHDKARDRAISATGLRVLRFTGSEIWRNPWQCVDEVDRVMDTMIREREG